ncbi:APC membrane recruitment protein 1-like [Thalassophryne amazonica]|uniref:APC membrane recruitment protein 1-like n=1 Tax=Thalassophryne amazonica TaxID=390379 RepID=UPI001471842F|nr:APC membrane recruitment protein 1-like [Thalassophryne amazonica]
MASHKVNEQPGDTTEVATASEQLSRVGPDDVAEDLRSDTSSAPVKSQKSGKFRRTALTFFGVRKSICILPNFFGGRNKNHNKLSSKKGIGKSKTYDGLCKASVDDSLRSGYVSGEDFEFHSQRDAVEDLHSGCNNECTHTCADPKLLTFTRQKRGFRSLFHSFRCHRNHKNVGLEKTEITSMPLSYYKKEVPVVKQNTQQYVAECLNAEPDVPDFADLTCNISSSPECTGADAVALEMNTVEQNSPKSEPDHQIEEKNFIGAPSNDYEEKSSQGHREPHLKLQMMPEPSLQCSAPNGSSDKLDLMFGDVASLKSFDSLTGCGDIIADQEDDSITQSTVSGERSRNGGKRASCFLTYQGGGEEMALPDDLDEDCLVDFWRNNTGEEICYTCKQDRTVDLTADLSSSHNMDLLNSSSAQQASGMDTSSISDVLTPQSEHQESVPNSDEGYYDSTTPGPDEGQEKNDRISTDRLPRDSYSGDALYELFAPDESLISPRAENKSNLPTSNQCEYLNARLEVMDSVFVPEMNQLKISAELYKVHNFLEIADTCEKSPELATFTVDMHEMGINKNCNPKLQNSDNMINYEVGIFDEKGNMVVPAEKTKCIIADCEKRHSNLSFASSSDPEFEPFCEPKEHLEENKPVALPYRNVSARSPDFSSLDHGQTVCFSQALVDYTKRAQMLNNTVAGLETNAAFTPNMQALPTIVTFDVVDLHNEGEYDEQIHMELEDISSPYQEFDESYLQKDAFADCDYQMLDVYEEDMFSNTWAIANSPRHTGLTRVGQPVANQLPLDKRSRCLEAEAVELKKPDKYRENRSAVVCCQTEKDTERPCSPYYKKNVTVSEVRDNSGVMSLTWQTRSELALSLPLTDGKITENLQSLSQTQVKHKILSSSGSSDFPNSKSHLCPNVSKTGSSDLISQSAELYNQEHRPPLQSDSSLPHSAFAYPGGSQEGLLTAAIPKSDDGHKNMFTKTATNLQSYNQCGKSRAVVKEGISHGGSVVNSVDFHSDTATAVGPVGYNKLPETALH